MHDTADAVIVGAGIVGTSVAHHLARLGALELDGRDHAGRGPVGFVTSAAYGYGVRRSLALAWLPADLAAPGTRLEIEYSGRRHPATVDPS